MEVVFGDVSACESVVYKYVVDGGVFDKQTALEPRSSIFAARNASNTLQRIPSGVPAGFTYRQGQRGCETAALPSLEEHLCDDTTKKKNSTGSQHPRRRSTISA